MIPIPLEEEPTRKELESKLMEMPELENHEEPYHTRMNDINTFMAHENEICLGGTDEHGKDFVIWFDSYDFLKWIDKEQLEYIKETLIKNIKKK